MTQEGIWRHQNEKHPLASLGSAQIVDKVKVVCCFRTQEVEKFVEN